jgi:hypothetical protein
MTRRNTSRRPSSLAVDILPASSLTVPPYAQKTMVFLARRDWFALARFLAAALRHVYRSYDASVQTGALLFRTGAVLDCAKWPLAISSFSLHPTSVPPTLFFGLVGLRRLNCICFDGR